MPQPMKWREWNDKVVARGPILYRYPPVTGSSHPSNDKPACYDMSLFGSRKPSHYARITDPEA